MPGVANHRHPAIFKRYGQVAREEVRSVLGIEVAPLDSDPLCAVYGGTPWEPWPVDVSVERFLRELQTLLTARDSA